jgi:hypothetical protein
VDAGAERREFGCFVGLLTRRSFLRRVSAVCWANGVDWEWELRRDGVVRKVVITLHGPARRLDAVERELRDLVELFYIGGGS